MLAAIGVAMCFDTTGTYTGPDNGACVLLERKLGRDLLHLACRHHVAELIPRAALEIFFRKQWARRHDFQSIQKAQEKGWQTFRSHDFEGSMVDATMLTELADCKDRVAAFVREQLAITCHNPAP